MPSPPRRPALPHGLLAVALAPLALVAPAGVASPAEPHLVTVSGAVEIGRGEPPEWREARSGDVVGAGDVVRTGRGGRAEIEFTHWDPVSRIDVVRSSNPYARRIAYDGST